MSSRQKLRENPSINQSESGTNRQNYSRREQDRRSSINRDKNKNACNPHFANPAIKSVQPMRNRQKPHDNEQANYDNGQRCELSHLALRPAFFVVTHLRA